jgi:alginate biosynthesis protein AlgX
MVCPEISDPKNYAVGAMKALKTLAPGRDKWLFRSEIDLANNFGVPKEFEPDLKRLINTFNDIGTEIVFIIQPTRGIMAYDKVLPEFAHGFDLNTAKQSYFSYATQLRKLGGIVPDLSELINTPPKDYFFRRDHHWTPLGAQITAKYVATYLQNKGTFDSLNTIDFITEPSIIIPKNGTMNRALNEICNNDYGFQYVQGYQTYQVKGDEESLFGDDDTAPEAVLVGTSNSALRDDDFFNYNFAGFLNESTKLDIVGYSLAGGGQEGALLQYILSEDYTPQDAPKLIFWELPVNYDLADDKIYRQLIPAIKGGCEEGEVNLSAVTEWNDALPKDTRLEILSNTGKQRKNINASDYFLELDLSNKMMKDFYIIVYYDNGRRDKVWFRRYDVVSGGKFYMEFNKGSEFQNQNILSIFMQPTQDEPIGTTVEAKVCKF